MVIRKNYHETVNFRGTRNKQEEMREIETKGREHIQILLSYNLLSSFYYYVIGTVDHSQMSEVTYS